MRSTQKIFRFLRLHLLILAWSAAAAQAQPAQEKIELQGVLKLGTPQTKTLAPGTVHVWNLTVKQGQYAVVEAVENSINLVVRIITPGSVQRAEFNTPASGWVTEKVTWIADTAGVWKVAIAPLRAIKTGDYEIKWVTQRVATARDQQTTAADSLNNLALTYYGQRKYTEVEPLFLRAIEIREKTLGPDHLDLAESLNSLGNLFMVQDKYEKVEPLYKRSLVIREKVLGSNHPTLARSLNNLAVLYNAQGKYAEAESFYKRSLDIKEKNLEPDHPDMSASLQNLAAFYYRQGRYIEAEPHFKRAVRIREKNLGPDHLSISGPLGNLAALYSAQARYAEAESLFLRSLNIAQKALGPDHAGVADPLNDLAAHYHIQGKYDEAEALYMRALSIWEKIEGPNKLGLAQTLDNLASLYSLQGKYAEAEPLYQHSLTFREKTRGSDHPDVGESLNNLGALYVDQGKFAEAEPLFKRSIAISEKTFGAEHLDVTQSLNNLALLYDHQGRYIEAGPLYERALILREKALGMDHPLVGESLNNLAALYVNQNKHAEAEPLYWRAIKIEEKSLGPNHPIVGRRLKSLTKAMFYKGGAPAETTLPLIERAIAILDAAKDNPNFRADLYVMRAQIRKQKGDWQRALADLAEALRLGEEMRPQTGRSEEIRADFFKPYAKSFDQIVSWELEAGQPQIAFDYSERARAGVLAQAIQESAAQTFAGIPDSLLRRDQALRDQILAYETEIQKARRKSNQRDSLKIGNLESQYQPLLTAHHELQKAFEQNYPRYYDLKYQTRSVAVADLQARLPDNAALLEYFVGDSALHIFVVSKTQFQAVAQPKDSSFIHLVDAFYQAVRKADTPKYLTSAHELYKILLAPVAEHLIGKERLIIIPHGMLYKVPFEALLSTPASANKKTPLVDYRKLDYLVRHFDLSYHYSASLYARGLQQKEPKISRNAFLGFAPVFRSNEVSGYTLASKDIPILREENNDEAVRAIVVDGRKFSELQHSEDEVKSIVSFFAQKMPQEPSLGYFHGQATEQNFKKACRNYRVVHVATHSFINEEKPALSGIIFAQPTDSTAAEDGVLYAGETYNLNLNADLVVLSSCESGLGKLIQGEGIMAMTRGFLYSGASNLLFSLWKAPDKPTHDLMVAFYRQMLAGKSYAQALRQAKLKMMTNKATAAPRLWSSFVLIGAK